MAPSAGDFLIGGGSPARDAGIDAGVSRDLDGQSRPMELGFDIGADEYGAGYRGAMPWKPLLLLDD